MVDRCKRRENVQPDDADDHWVMEFEQMKKKIGRIFCLNDVLNCFL